jgi:hypothetical protein
VLFPRPSALGVLLRMGQPAKEELHEGTAGPCALTGFGFQKIFCAKNAKKISRTFRKSTPSALGSGAHSRRFAQECPEGNPGKYKQGELTWHSTKTRSR